MNAFICIPLGTVADIATSSYFLDCEHLWLDEPDLYSVLTFVADDGDEVVDAVRDSDAHLRQTVLTRPPRNRA